MDNKILIEDIAFAMQNNSCYSFYKTATKEVIMIPEDYGFWIEEEEEEYNKIMEDDYEEGEYIKIRKSDSRESFGLMESFTDELEEGRLKNELYRALSERKPFRTFRFVLDGNDEYLQKWYKYRDNYYNQKAIEFLKENNIK